MNSFDIYTSQASSYQAKAVQQHVQRHIMQKREDKELLSACQDFEALFIKQMLDSMRQTIPNVAAESNNFSKGIYEDMLYNEYAQKMAKTARLGIAEMLYNQMIK